MNSLGIDFGTTNTVFATPSGEGDARILPVLHHSQTIDAFRTTLGFRRSQVQEPKTEAGPFAIDWFVDAPEETRFLQSFKSFAASSTFQDTAIFAKRMKFEDLLQRFIATAADHAGVKALPKRLVIGRPVTFAGGNPNDALAQQRYKEAFKALGVDELHFVLEPVAAAFFFAKRLTRAATILVGDFGGGTSDFSIMHFEPDGKATALGHGGIGIAGDSFDYRIIDAVVSPRLGKHATYKSWDKELHIPVHYFTNFSRWNELCLMNRPSVIAALQQFADASPQRVELEAFIDLIEGGMSYELYQTIAKAKAALSSHEEVSFGFRASKVNISQTVKRSDFEHWIAGDVQKIAACVDQVLSKSGLPLVKIDRVFLTGGSSYVPAVRQLFVERFGEGRLETGDQLVSIAKGLALISGSDDAGKWAA